MAVITSLFSNPFRRGFHPAPLRNIIRIRQISQHGAWVPPIQFDGHYQCDASRKTCKVRIACCRLRTGPNMQSAFTMHFEPLADSSGHSNSHATIGNSGFNDSSLLIGAIIGSRLAADGFRSRQVHTCGLPINIGNLTGLGAVHQHSLSSRIRSESRQISTMYLS